VPNRSPPKKKTIRVGLISLGCAKNLVDAEIMVGSLLKGGMEITNDPAEADVMIVNTCSFIDSAQEESVDAILESAAIREAKKRGQGLIVSGCLPQRFRGELPKLLPEVDAFMGLDQITQVAQIVQQAMTRRAQRVSHPKSRIFAPKSNVSARLAELESKRAILQLQDSRSDPEPRPLLEIHQRPTFIPDFATPRFRLTPRHFAYVKIAEGCNHPCSFCIIPRMRGSHRSRKQSDIVAEAKALIADGVKELNLISQDSTYYGLDLRQNHNRAISSPERFSSAVKTLPTGGSTLCTLLRELNSLPGDFWIRVLYTHPAHWTDELIRTIAECRKVARYVDIPLQHIHQNMLERMRRETSRQYIVELLNRIRAGVPGIALRSTFIVGFPGETEACFQDLLDFIRTTKFERLGVFSYSKEDGTRAGAMAGQIPAKEKLRRRNVAMAVQQSIAREFAASFVGKEIKVLVEGRNTDAQTLPAETISLEHGLQRVSPVPLHWLDSTPLLVARSEADAPDIDGRVFVRGRRPIGRFSKVRVIDHSDYELLAMPERTKA